MRPEEPTLVAHGHSPLCQPLGSRCCSVYITKRTNTELDAQVMDYPKLTRPLTVRKSPHGEAVHAPNPYPEEFRRNVAAVARKHKASLSRITRGTVACRAAGVGTY